MIQSNEIKYKEMYNNFYDLLAMDDSSVENEKDNYYDNGIAILAAKETGISEEVINSVINEHGLNCYDLAGYFPQTQEFKQNYSDLWYLYDTDSYDDERYQLMENVAAAVIAKETGISDEEIDAIIDLNNFHNVDKSKDFSLCAKARDYFSEGQIENIISDVKNNEDFLDGNKYLRTLSLTINEAEKNKNNDILQNMIDDAKEECNRENTKNTPSKAKTLENIDIGK